MLEKVKFLKENKNVIINNLTPISYSLYKVLISDESLDKIDDYNQIINYLESKKKDYIKNEYEFRDEKYILQTLLSFVDKVAYSLNEKDEARNNLYRYNRYFEKNNAKVKVRSAV